MKKTCLIIREDGVYLNGRKLLDAEVDKVNEITSVNTRNDLVVDDRIHISLPPGIPADISISGPVLGDIKISSCRSLNILGDVQGDVQVASGKVRVNNIVGNVQGGACELTVMGNIEGEVNISAGKIITRQ